MKTQDGFTLDHQSRCHSMQHKDHGTVAGTVSDRESLEAASDELDSFLELLEEH